MTPEPVTVAGGTGALRWETLVPSDFPVRGEGGAGSPSGAVWSPEHAVLQRKGLSFPKGVGKDAW